MEHNFLDLNLESEMHCQVIHQRDNNLDKIDNLDELPEHAAVFAVCGRVNGKPANPRYVSQTANLRKETQKLFDKNEPAPVDAECFKEFMMSIKTKELVYKILQNLSEPERLDVKNKWIKNFQPQCNEALNEIR